MKKIFTLIAAVIMVTVASAQSPTAYFMEGSTVRSQFNPAFAPTQGYINMPLLGGLNVNLDGNLALDNVLFPRNGKLVTILDNSVSPSEALDNLEDNNLLGLDTKLSIFGLGLYTKNKKSFWSFDIGVRATENTQFPKELFEFIKNGESCSISNIQAELNSYLEASVNYSMPLLDDKLYLGARIKVLAGMARAKVNYDQFDITLNEDKWIVESHGSMELYAADAKIENNGTSTYELGDIDCGLGKPAGFGFGIDLGATYQILPQLQASLAVIDLGYVNWSKDYAIIGVSSPEPLEFSGITYKDGTVLPQPDFSLQMLEFERQAAEGAKNALRTRVNLGANYQLWDERLDIGILYSARLQEHTTFHNITGSVNIHPLNWFTLTGSYTVIANYGGSIGLGLNIHVPGFNIFVASDVITAKLSKQFIPINKSNFDVSFGLAFNIGKRGER